MILGVKHRMTWQRHQKMSQHESKTEQQKAFHLPTTTATTTTTQTNTEQQSTTGQPYQAGN